MDELIAKVEGLRSFYDADNRVGLLLDELAADLKNGAPREEVVTEAREVQDLVGSSANAHKVIEQVLHAMAA